MGRFNKIFHHISTDEVKKKHQDNIDQLRIQEEKEIKLLEYTSSMMEKVKYDWRSEDNSKNLLREKMTTSSVMSTHLSADHEDNPGEETTIDASLEASFQDGPEQGSTERMMFKGVTIKNSGSGTGDNGGFNIGKHLAFSHNANSDGSNYVDTSSRHALLAPIDARNADTITITAIRGNDSNGGELPDYTDEDLRLSWFNTNSTGTDGGDWMSIDFENIGVRHNDVSPTIIPQVWGDSGGYDGDSPGLRDWTITIPDYCKNENQRFALVQYKHSGSGYDHYGITAIKYNSKTPSSVFVPLDSPEAASFIRVGQPASLKSSAKKRKKKIEDMLAASKKYTEIAIGKDFPGMGTVLDPSVASPIGKDEVAQAHRDAGTLSQQLKKALGKDTGTEQEVSPIVKAMKDVGKEQSVKAAAGSATGDSGEDPIDLSVSDEVKNEVKNGNIENAVNKINQQEDLSAKDKLGELNTILPEIVENNPDKIPYVMDNVSKIGSAAVDEKQNSMIQAFDSLKNMVSDTVDWSGDFINGFGDSYTVLNQMSQAVSSAYKNGDVVNGELRDGALGSMSNPVKTKVSTSTAQDILQGVDIRDLIYRTNFSDSTRTQLLSNLSDNPISGNLGAKAIHNNLAPSNAKNIRINKNGDLVIPDNYAFRAHGHEKDSKVQAYANMIALFGGNREDAVQDMATILDQSIGAIFNLGQKLIHHNDPTWLLKNTARTGGFVPGRDDPGIQFETIIPRDQLLEILRDKDSKLPFPEASIKELEKLSQAQKLSILDGLGANPYSDENYKKNLPSWFFCAGGCTKDEYGRIWGNNFSGGYGVLVPGTRPSGPYDGSAESGYGTRGFNYETNTGGTPWTFISERDVPAFPEGMNAYNDGSAKTWSPPETDKEFEIWKKGDIRWNTNKNTEPSTDTSWGTERQKIFQNNVKTYGFEQAKWIDSYNNTAKIMSQSRLPFRNRMDEIIKEKGRVAGQKTWEYRNLQNKSNTVDKFVNGYTNLANKKDYKGLNSYMSNENIPLDIKSQLGGQIPTYNDKGELTMQPLKNKYGVEYDPRYEMSDEVRDRLQKQRMSSNSLQKGQEQAPYSYKLGGNSITGVAGEGMKTVKIWGRDTDLYEAQEYTYWDGVGWTPSRVDTNHWQGHAADGYFSRAMRYLYDPELKADPEKREKYGNGTYMKSILNGRTIEEQITYYRNFGKTSWRFAKQVPDGRGGTRTEPGYYMPGETYYQDSIEYWKKKIEEAGGTFVDAFAEVIDTEETPLKPDDEETPPKPDEELPPGKKWELIPATYSDDYHGKGKGGMVAPPMWTQVDIDDTNKVTPADEKWLGTQQTLVNLTKSLTHIGLPNDFGQWSINYAKGNMEPINKFSRGMEKEVEKLVLQKFKENPNSKSVTISYDDYGGRFNAMSTRLGLGTFKATRLPNGKVQIDDTFNVDKTFKTVGAFDIIPGLQATANRIVDIAHKRRSGTGDIKHGTYDYGGIPVKVILDMGSKLKKVDYSIDEPIFSTPSKKKKKSSNNTSSKWMPDKGEKIADNSSTQLSNTMGGGLSVGGKIGIGGNKEKSFGVNYGQGNWGNGNIFNWDNNQKPGEIPSETERDAKTNRELDKELKKFDIDGAKLSGITRTDALMMMQIIKSGQGNVNGAIETLRNNTSPSTFMNLMNQIPRAKKKVNSNIQVAHYEPQGELVKENTVKRIIKWRKKFEYEGKPSPEGFPDTPQVELDPKTQMHPNYGKHSARYKKLDPASADAMPKTGDPETDAIVAKQKSKFKKVKVNFKK